MAAAPEPYLPQGSYRSLIEIEYQEMSAVSQHANPDMAHAPNELDRRERVLIDTIRAAGAMAQTAFETGGASYELKGPQDFLTVTDAAVEKFIRDELLGQFPQDGFLGEESGSVLGESVWVVDPIDGTANFARRIPHYCISIALASGTDILLGAIYDPAHDELYLARQGRGATRNGEPIQVSSVTDTQSACVELGWSTRVTNETYLQVLTRILSAGVNSRRAATGALGLAYVADGRSDAYAELHMHPWDCLAGLLLVREAGGKVCNFLASGGLEIGGGVLASSPGVASMMSDATGIPCN
ncbi:inositol monophosphatase family protein [Roseinatronobacter alkalisoli]|uniref:Inositol-1-monophosphatase n=1 Tax=Roseinatronobacter alkalisoli TaxID=3028235 RepID=A0ABT5T4C5_9RHOB|nr:inositol monophosphatase family protein [Roseinatronobacter sp. HJB301]MDD7969968.1 inositol monophosphatase family protein [Roseinatronobacter sp. HJB301]